MQVLRGPWQLPESEQLQLRKASSMLRRASQLEPWCEVPYDEDRSQLEDQVLKFGQGGVQNCVQRERTTEEANIDGPRRRAIWKSVQPNQGAETKVLVEVQLQRSLTAKMPRREGEKIKEEERTIINLTI